MAQTKVAHIGVADILPGMVLAADAHDRKGRLLASKGTVLTLSAQRQMRLWGVETVAVERSSAPPAPTTPMAELAPTPISELLHLDSSDPFMQELTRFAQHLYERRQRAPKRVKEGSRR